MVSNNLVKIIVAESHKLIKDGLIQIINSFPGFIVVDEAEDAQELITKCSRLSPNLALVELEMAPISGCDAFLKINRIQKNIKFIFMAMSVCENQIQRVTKIGAHGLVSKCLSVPELHVALASVVQGQTFFCQPDSRVNREEEIIIEYKDNGSIRTEILSSREYEIMNLLSRGLSTKEIADKLFLSKRTIDSHRGHIISKFNLKGSSDLVKFAIEHHKKNGYD